MCQNKIQIDYSKKVFPRTDDIISIGVRTPLYRGSKKPADLMFRISICNHCKGILGISKED